MELAKTYEPAAVEERWYRVWRERGYFHGDEKRPGKTFSMVIPPPNVTGSLHMGHALNNTIQDILCRYHRMLGEITCWVPGTDHAGIATQNVVERQLAAAGMDRRALGREKFVERVWSWKRESGRRSRASSLASACPATGSASASRWTRGCRAPSARCSSHSTSKA